MRRREASVVHCQAGKDRTGLVTALLLRLAGVPTDEVALDYAESERHLAARNEDWIAEGADEAERDWRRRRRARRRPTGMPACSRRSTAGTATSRPTCVRVGRRDADLDAARARLLDD